MTPPGQALSSPAPTRQMARFMAHLRLNGFRVGLGETVAALAWLAERPADAEMARLGLKAMLSADRDQ